MNDPIDAVISLIRGSLSSLLPDYPGLTVAADLATEDTAMPFVAVEETPGTPQPVGGGPDVHCPGVRTSAYAKTRAEAKAIGKALAPLLDWSQPDLGPGGESIRLVPTAEPHTGREPDPRPENEPVFRCMLNHVFLYREI